MSPLLVLAAALLGLLGIGGAGYFAYSRLAKKNPEDVMMHVAGELRITYEPKREDKPAFASGTYSGRGVTLDFLNEKGYMDRWHPHSRVVVSVDKSVRDTHIVAYRGRFYSRKLGEVKVDNTRFNSDYVFLSSSTKKGEKIVMPEVANWVVNLDMPFILSDGHIVFHQEKHFEDKTRVKHIIDALVYIATMAERVR